MKSLIVLLLSLAFWLTFRIIAWRLRVTRIRRTMPVIPTLFDPYQLVRMFIPKRLQRYHSDWQFQQRKQFNDLGTGLVPLIPLFGLDVLYVSDADAILEMATNPNRFRKDLKLYSLGSEG